MRRTVKSVPVGGQVRHVVTIEDDPSAGPDIARRRYEFLVDLVTNGVFQGLLNCGPVPFDSLKMTYNGTCWVVQLEALEEAHG